MPAKDPTDRTLIGEIAAHARWSRCPDRRAAMAPARRGYLLKYERQVDPDSTLAPEERQRRAASALQADMARLALLSAQARRRNAEGAARRARSDGGEAA